MPRLQNALLSVSKSHSVPIHRKSNFSSLLISLSQGLNQRGDGDVKGILILCVASGTLSWLTTDLSETPSCVYLNQHNVGCIQAPPKAMLPAIRPSRNGALLTYAALIGSAFPVGQIVMQGNGQEAWGPRLYRNGPVGTVVTSLCCDTFHCHPHTHTPATCQALSAAQQP